MQRVQQPPQERDRVSLLGHLVFALAPPRDLLQELVRACLALEQAGVPHALCQLGEALDQLGGWGLGELVQLRGVGVEEERADRRDMQDEVEDDIHVVVGADVVQSDEAGQVGRAVEREGLLGREEGERVEALGIVARVEDVDDVL